MKNDSERPVFESHVHEVVEIRGIVNVTVPSQGNSQVNNGMKSIGGRGNGPIQVIQDDVVIGIEHHVNVFNFSFKDKSLIQVFNSVKPGDIVRFVGVVTRYSGFRGVPKYDVKQIVEFEVL